MHAVKDTIAERFHFYNHRTWTFVSPILISTLFGIMLYLAYILFRFTDPWSSWQAAIGNTLHFCELNRPEQLIVQPSNTWSNLGYLLVGLLLISIGIKDHYFTERIHLRNPMARKPGFTILLGAAMIYLFLGSFLYHASLTRAFQRMDVNGIYAVVLALFAYNIYRIFPFYRWGGKRRSTHSFVIMMALLTTLAFYLWLWDLNVNIVFPSLLGIFLVVNIINIHRHRNAKRYTAYLNASISCLLLGSFIWILDRSHIFCIPDSILQGHALWHLLTASSVLFLYLFYRGERFSSILFAETSRP